MLMLVYVIYIIIFDFLKFCKVLLSESEKMLKPMQSYPTPDSDPQNIVHYDSWLAYA